jgi:putative zinc finger protein
MTLLTCAAVRRRLAAFHDRELPVNELIAVESHLKDCPPCGGELQQLQSVGEALRLAAAPGPADDWTGLASGVIGRMRAEANESWSARAARMFEDMHLVWIGLASTAATFICGAAVLGMLHFAAESRNDSLAAVIAVVAAPSGSDLNPAQLNSFIQVPSVPKEGIVSAALEKKVSEQDLVLALSAVVSREGRVSDLSVLTNDHDRQQLMDLLDALSRERLAPAQFGGAPVAVNLVWLVAQTTVRAKITS